MVPTQSLTVPLLGVELFTVAIAAGRTVGSMLADGIGFGPGGRRKVEALRGVGAVVAMAGVRACLAADPRRRRPGLPVRWQTAQTPLARPPVTAKPAALGFH